MDWVSDAHGLRDAAQCTCGASGGRGKLAWSDQQGACMAIPVPYAWHAALVRECACPQTGAVREWAGAWDCMILIHASSHTNPPRWPSPPDETTATPLNYAHQAQSNWYRYFRERYLLPVNYLIPLQMKTQQTRRNIVLVLRSFRSMSTIQRHWIPGKSTDTSIH